MRDGDICLIKTGLVEGRQWRESNYAIGVYYKGMYYSDEVMCHLFHDIDSEQWNITAYVEGVMVGYNEKLSDEVIEYLER